MSIEKEIQGFGSASEETYGFAQAVRVKDTIYVSGQTAYSDTGQVVGEGEVQKGPRGRGRRLRERHGHGGSLPGGGLRPERG